MLREQSGSVKLRKRTNKRSTLPPPRNEADLLFLGVDLVPSSDIRHIIVITLGSSGGSRGSLHFSALLILLLHILQERSGQVRSLKRILEGPCHKGDQTYTLEQLSFTSSLCAAPTTITEPPPAVPSAPNLPLPCTSGSSVTW